MSQAELVKSLLEVCAMHASKMAHARRKIASIGEITPESIQNPPEEIAAYLDQFAFRFGRLQDDMGAKLMPAVLELVQEDSERLTMIDRLNKLEKLEAIPSRARWMEMRLVRNQFAHEYPDKPELRVASLQSAIQSSGELEATLNQIAGFARKYL